MYDVRELSLLASALVMRNISFTFKKANNGYAIIGEDWDVAINTLTMGAADGLIEVLIWDEWAASTDYNAGAYGFLTASEALELLENKGLISQD